MAYFAEIDENNIVKRVIVAEQKFIDSGAVGDPKNWIETCKDTFKGKHSKGGKPLRMNYAGVGNIYDKEKDAFIPQKPDNQFLEEDEEMVLDEKTCQWKRAKKKII